MENVGAQETAVESCAASCPGTGELEADLARARSLEITACGRMKSVCGFRTPGQAPEVGQEEGDQVEAQGQNKMPVRAERFQRGRLLRASRVVRAEPWVFITR